MKRAALKLILISVLLIVLLMVAFTFSSVVQGMPHPEWSKAYLRFPDYSVNDSSVSAHDQGTCIVQTTDGGYVVGGIMTDQYSAPHSGGGVTNSTSWLIKTDAFGEVQWEKAISEEWRKATSEYPRSIFQTEDSGFLVSGDTQVLKTDASGNAQWNKTIEGPWSIWDYQTYYDMKSTIQSTDGSFVFAGGIPDYFSDAFIFKIDEEGNLLWNVTFSSDATWVRAYDLVETISGDFAVAGHAVGAWFALLGSDGSLKANKTLGGGFFNSLVQTKDGGFALAGGTYRGGIDNQGQGLLVKVDSKGMFEWNHTYDDPPIAGLELLSLAQTADEGYVLAGRSALLKVDKSGHLQWRVSYGPTSGDPRADSAVSVASTNDSGFIVAGTQNESIWVAKFSLSISILSSSVLEFLVWILVPLATVIVLLVIIAVRKEKVKK